MKSDLNDLKKLTMKLMQNDNLSDVQKDNEGLIQKIYNKKDTLESEEESKFLALPSKKQEENIVEIVKDTEEKFTYIDAVEEQEEQEETLSLHDKELELIKKSLERHKGKRKLAADELGISERTLYRKIKQYDL